MSTPAIFLDRDGVLNTLVFRGEQLSAPWTMEEFQLLPGVADAVQSLTSAGYRVIVLTNQPDVAHGSLSSAMLEDMHAALRKAVPVDAILVCPHTWEEACVCKKPRPGMAQQAAQEYDLDLPRSFVIGDRPADVNLAHALGIPAVLIRTQATDWHAAPLLTPPAYEATDLTDAAAWVRMHALPF